MWRYLRSLISEQGWSLLAEHIVTQSKFSLPARRGLKLIESRVIQFRGSDGNGDCSCAQGWSTSVVCAIQSASIFSDQGKSTSDFS